MLAIQKLKFLIPLSLVREWADEKLLAPDLTEDERKTYEAVVVATVATVGDVGISLTIAQLVDMGVSLELAKKSVVEPGLFDRLENDGAPANN